MKLSIRASLAVVLVACFGCSSSGGTSSGEKLQPAPVATISVSPSAASLESGKTQQMSAVAKDAAGNVLSGVSFSWQSDATAVASVDGSGLVTGALVGTAHITASAQGVSGGADVSVKAGALAHIEISPAGGTVIVGQDLALGALASDAAGNPISGSAFKWTSDNPEVGKVDPATGIASGVAAAGENAAQAHIKASSSGIDSAAVTLTVKPIPIGSITVTPGSSTIHVGKTLQLRAAATDLDRAPLPGVSFTWESDNEAVAIVDANGLVTGVASGTAHFTAFAGRSPKVISNAATLTVNVLSVSVDPPAVSLSPGAGTQFGAKLANVISNSSVTWSVQEALGGTIDASGKYNAPCRAGPFHVVATSVEDPGKSAIATVTIARPRSGTLDSCFNGTGKLTTFLGGPAAANAMVRQPDGKIVVVGKVTPKDSTHSNFVVVRYTQEGSLDEKFGDGDGFVMTDFGIASEAFAVALQLDGKEQKIVVAGAAGSSFGIARYHQDGKPDTSFNPTAKVSGTRMDAVGFCGSEAHALVIVPGTAEPGTSKIIAGGTGCQAPLTAGGAPGFALVRYTANGAIDTTFAKDGKVFANPVAPDDVSTLKALVRQSDGKLVAGGTVDSGDQTAGNFALVRWTADGALDPTFGSRGVAVTAVGNVTLEAAATSLAVQKDGALVLAGYGTFSISPVAKLFAKRFAVVRFTSAGVLDTAFGTDGLATATFAVNSNERAFGVGIGQGGNIVLAGDTSMTTGAPAFAVTRFTSSGALDKSFNGTGIVTTPIRKLSTALAMTFTSENDLSTELITVAGFSDGDFALARYWP